MGELFNPYPRLPKNIRQIGERETLVKLYMEDYVSTYLKRLYPSGGKDLRVGILLGTSEIYEGTPYIFIDGALEMEDVTSSGEKVTFTEAAWKKAYKSMEETFPKRTVQGWFLCGASGCCLSPFNYLRQHNQYFGGKYQLMYLNCGIDGEETLYAASEDSFYRLKGYQVYYERNQMMQDYMILRKDSHRVESGSGDRVIRDFRTRLEDRKAEAMSRNRTIRTLGTLCSVLSIAVLAGGVVMFNNYQKMKEMESVLVSVLPEQVKRLGASSVPEEDSDFIVEEIRGSVSPETLPEQSEADAVWDKPASEASGDGLTPAGEYKEANGQSGKVKEQSGEATEDVLSLTGRSGEEAGETRQEEPSAELSDRQDSTEPPLSGGNATAQKDYPVTNARPGESYLIGEGETLYGICFALYGNLKYLDDIRALNGLDDADHIMAGQKLILPDLSEDLG